MAKSRAEAKKDHVAIAWKYQAGVLTGKIPACRWIRLACERNKRDLNRQGRKFGFRFCPERAARICKFIELLPHVKGEWAARGEKIELEPWQCWILCCVFGWLEYNTDRRRFRIVYTEVPRKNAKSALTSGVALYMLAADGEEGAEVYSAATKRDQARAVYDTARGMVDRLPAMRQSLGVQTNSLAIFIPGKMSTFKALAKAKGGGGANHDGLNVSCAVVDELHAHPDASMWDVLCSAVGSRAQPLIWAITTAGHNRASVCYEQRTYLCKILEGVTADERMFGAIWSIDADDDWRKPEAWIKANPNWGVSVMPDAIEAACSKAVNLSSARSEFLTKHLNVWLNADAAWMDMQAWDACADPSLRIEDFKNDECIMGADLAAKDDFCSVVKLFRREISGVAHYYAFARHYNNAAAIERNPNPSLKAWAEDGHVRVVPGNATEFEPVELDIRADFDTLRAREVAFDPHQAWQISQNLTAAGHQVVEFAMNVGNLSEPTKELMALVSSGRLHHDGDPVLAWMISNVVGHTDAQDRIFPKREKSMRHNKIDGAIALIIALGRWMQAPKVAEKSFKVMII